MNQLGKFLQTRWGAIALWVVVMYAAAGLWGLIDDDGWYAFPSYVIIVLAWTGSFLYMLASFIEWQGGKLQLKRASPPPPAPAEPPSFDD